MASIFTSDFFRGNRKRLRKLIAQDIPIVIAANGQLQRSSDYAFPFRQDSNFWYLTGLNDPDLVLVIDANQEYILVPNRHPVIDLFDGSHDLESYARTSDIHEILTVKEGWPKLNERIRKVKTVATLMPMASYMKFYEFYANPARARLIKKMKRANPTLQLEDVRSYLMNMRMIKQPPELKALQGAIDATVQTLATVSRNGFREYNYEYEIEADIAAGFRKRGTSGTAWQPIVANGANACQIHYIDNSARLDRAGLLLLDVGAEYQNYCSDISRTYALSEPTARQKAVYQAVLDVQTYGISQVKPGISFREHDNITRAYMGEKLMELGLIKDTAKESINKYYPHYSHFLGLDVHDSGDYQRAFEPGMVITVEPGIYIPEEGIGVRIEDDILITENGNRVLSAELPSKLQG